MRLQLPPGISYYIRKLIRQNLDRLHFDTEDGQGIPADATSDLNEAIAKLYSDDAQANFVVNELERLAIVHKTLSSQGVQHQPDLQKTEEQIFSLLSLKPQDRQRRGTILIVDDTQASVNLLALALRRQGYTIHTASSGQEALEAIQNAIPDVLLLDIMMPEMDGYEVCEHLKSYTLTRDIPIIFVTALQEASNKVKAFGVGGADYITKPFHIEEVLVRVDHQIKLHSLQKRLESQNIRLQNELLERRQMEERYRSLFERSNEGMFQSTLEGQFLYVNRALAHLCGYASAEELIEAIEDIGQQMYVQPDRREDLIRQLQEESQVLGAVSEIYRKDGSKIWISENIHAVRDANGKFLYYEGIVQPFIVEDPTHTPQLQVS